MPDYFIILVIGILGAIFGSFLNCAAWRIANHESILYGRSHCTSCGHTLGVLDLVPLFSWLLLGGKCRYCGAKISIRYFLVELMMAILSIRTFLQSDFSLVLYSRNFILLCCLFCLTLVDLDIFEIPNSCVLIPVLGWIVFSFFLNMSQKDIIVHLITGVVLAGIVLAISLIFDKVLQKESMGGGDIKLLFVMGLYLGPVGSLFGLFIACILGLFTALTLQKVRNNGEEMIPFGPAIAGALYFMLLYGDGIVSWYMSFLA